MSNGLLQDLSVIVMSDITSSEVKLVEDPQEIHKIFKRSFIDEQEFYLYKYVASEELELQKDRADPFVRRCALKVHTRASRRPWYFVWNHFAITVRQVKTGMVSHMKAGTVRQIKPVTVRHI